MTKKQKIWLGVFLGMFIVPELLWSPVLNFVYSFLENNNNPQILRSNFLMTIDYRNLVIFVIFVQFVGLIGSFISIIRSEIIFWKKAFLIFLISLLLIATGFIFFLVFSLRNGIGF
jgi:hypothetical protein